MPLPNPLNKHIAKEEEIFNFMAMVRDSGKSNMCGSGYLVEHYDMNKREASAWVVHWVKSLERKRNLKNLLLGDN